ncbi:hypothetical protein HYX19_01210 [Candidatus Woesearchaeota archaeon]|nr:hypothetical protein [Candidatus Woesearchaeota archaeon]
MVNYVNVKITQDEFNTIRKMVDGSSGKYNSIEEWISSAIVEKFLNEKKK